jgi:3-hydroxyisobutyrate dehydrogenase
MLKDLGLAQQSALSVSAPTPLGGLVRQLYQMHAQSGHAQQDFSSIVHMLKPDVNKS